jgi:hypothetical protein
VAAVRARGALHRLDAGAAAGQVQVERGGSWVLAQTQPGGRITERQLKKHGAARRCEVCKATADYRAGELTAPEALARAGWDRSNPAQRSLLLDIFGLPEPPTAAAAQPSETAAAPAPALVAPGLQVPGPRPEPPLGWAWPGRPVAALDPELDAVVDALVQSWTTPEPDAHRQPESLLEAGL